MQSMIIKAPKIHLDNLGRMFLKYFFVELKPTQDANCEILVKFGNKFYTIMNFSASESPKNIRELFWLKYKMIQNRGVYH